MPFSGVTTRSGRNAVGNNPVVNVPYVIVPTTAPCVIVFPELNVPVTLFKYNLTYLYVSSVTIVAVCLIVPDAPAPFETLLPTVYEFDFGMRTTIIASSAFLAIEAAVESDEYSNSIFSKLKKGRNSPSAIEQLYVGSKTLPIL